MFQFPVRAPKLQVETHSHGAEDSHTAQSDNRESTTLERRVYVGLEVEIVLVILNHPETEIRNYKRLDYDQDLDRTGSVSSYSLDMFARKLPPDLEALSSNPAHLAARFDMGELCPRE